jgi:hypothetical protein
MKGKHGVKLTRADADFLAKPIRGVGGRQSLIRRLQAGVHRDEHGDTLTITEEDVERCIRQWGNTGGEPGHGGFQRRLPMQSLAEAGLVPARVDYRPQNQSGDLFGEL